MAIRWQPMSEDDPRHGTTNGYMNRRCRCERCKEAWRKKSKERRKYRIEKGLPDDDPRHGTATGYSSYQCRCEKCKKAYKIYRESQLPKPQKPKVILHGTRKGYMYGKCRCDACIAAMSAGLADDDPRHGTRSAYAYWGCRCEKCKNFQREYQKGRR